MVLSSALKQVVKERIIPYNPCDNCRIPPKGKKEMAIIPPEKLGVYLSEAEKYGVLSIMQPSPVFIPKAALINPYTIKEGITKARSCPGLCAVEPVSARGWSAYSWTRSLGYTVSPLH